MAIQNAPAASASAVGAAQPAATSASPSRPWLIGAFLLAGAAQLITISALVSVDPLSATWGALLLAIAPVLLTAAAAFGPRAAALPAALAAVVALVAGIAGEITHIGAFFVPALVVLIIGVIKLWPERSSTQS